jgi:predicted DNA-binding transcriptional regulator AlpA
MSIQLYPSYVLLQRPAVAALLGISPPTLDRLRRDDMFPRPVRVTPGRIAWRRDELLRWLASRPRAVRR